MTTRLSGTYIRLRQPKEVAAGILVLALLAGVVLAAVLLVWPRPLTSDEHVAVDFLFEQGAGLTPGDPVLLAGVRIGFVEAVELEAVGRVRVGFSVPVGYAPRRDATARIGALNLLGDRYLAYAPGTAGDPLPPGTPLAGEGDGGPLSGFLELEDRAAKLALEIQGLAADTVMREELAQTVAALERAATMVRETAIHDMPAHAREVLATPDRVDGRVAALAGHAALDTATIRLADMTSQLATVAEQLAEAQERLTRIQERLGDGSLGRLRRDTVIANTIEYLKTLSGARR